ncbi:MAG: ribbon-helix-helix domain-containing protein [Streptosporangiaceae bacterium]
MKVSVSLPDDDVEFLDAYAQSQGIESRSAVVHKAVRMLRASELGEAYEDAFTSWEDEGEAAIWDAATADGLEK